MKKSLYFNSIIILCAVAWAQAQAPNPALVGYWQNWNDFNSPYIPLDQTDSRYNYVVVSFATPKFGTDYQMQFSPEQVSPTVFASQIQTLQSQGRKVSISVGGANDPVSLDNETERDSFISSMIHILNVYNFDGLDIDLEGSSIAVTGGSIADPVDAKIIHLIEAVKEIMGNYHATHGRRLLLTMAPETAFVQGGMSAYSNIWGAYLPVIHALRDSMEILYVQLYNSGTMYGIDGGIYGQGSADFIAAMTEAVIQGFNTAGGTFAGLPAEKVAIGLPACKNAAGGYVSPAAVKAAIDYLRGNGSQPGVYSLQHTEGYPALRGMMTWSVNWDAIGSCGAKNEYADNYEAIFGAPSADSNPIADASSLLLFPNPAKESIHIYIPDFTMEESAIQICNIYGSLVLTAEISSGNQILDISNFPRGIYILKYKGAWERFVKL